MGKKIQGEMSFLEHLEELRWHLIRAIAGMIVCAILAFIFKDIIFDKIILAPKSPEFWTNRMLCSLSERLDVPKLCLNSTQFEIISVKLQGQFMTHITVSLIAGLIMAFPYVFLQFWNFVSPALHSKERKYARGAVVISSLLFLLGVAFGYFLIVPFTINFLGGYSVSSDVDNKINLISYVSTVSSVVLAAGVIFELPIVVYFLSKIGLITPQFMRKYRKHSIVVVLILASIITPPDVFSQILVSIPLLILYEISIYISAGVVRRRMKEDEENNS